jgi:hypothetical protein
MVRKGKLGLYWVLSVLVAAIMVVPVIDLGSGDEGEKPVAGNPLADIEHGTYDMKSINIEQNVIGTVSGGWMGYSLVDADLDNDNIDDIIVSAPASNAGKGAIYIYFGPNYNRALTEIDADVTIQGYKASGVLGLNIRIGDVDADGLVDLLVTGFSDPNIGTTTAAKSEAYLFLGATGWNGTMDASDADVIFQGRDNYALGYSAALGDLDDDGKDDIVLGSAHVTSTVYDGEVFIWKGRDVFESVYNVTLEEYDHWIYNTNKTVYLGKTYNGFGTTGIELGDINGDDYMDIIMGSQYRFTTEPLSGEVDVVYGGRNMLKNMNLELISYLRVTGFANNQIALATHADIDGDGIEDLLVTAPAIFKDPITGGLVGATFAFHGKTDLGTGTKSIFNYDFMIRGPKEGFPFGVMPLGDLDGDGRTDLSIYSARGADYDNSGCYYILYMSETDAIADPKIFEMKFVKPSTVIKGPLASSKFGYLMKPNLVFMDFDGDGNTDMAISDYAANAAGYQSNAGLVYILFQVVTEVKLDYFELLAGDGEMGNILGAGKTYYFQGRVENTWSLQDFRAIDIFFQLHGGGLEGQSIAFYWDRGLMQARIKSSPGDFVVMESSSFNPDDRNGMIIYMNISFKPTIPTEDFMDLVMEVEAGKGLNVLLSKPKLFRVECDVEFLGDFTVTAGVNGVIQAGEFVQAGEQIEISGVRVVYVDTEASPPNDYFSVRMSDSYGNVFLDSTTSGRDIYFTYATGAINGREIINLEIVDLTAEAEDATGGIEFYYVVDTDLPEAPYDLEVRADSDIDTLMGYDDDPNVWVMWAPADDATSNVIGYLYNTYDAGTTPDGTFVDRAKFEFKGLLAGWNTIYVWSVDQALNYGPAASISVYYDTEAPGFMQPTPAPGNWVNTNDVFYEITLSDEGGSGVQGRSIEYSISNDGGRTYGAWEPTNIKRTGDQITVKTLINFREGKENFIMWRAKDVAGNGYIESEPFQLKVDTLALTYKDAIPELPQDSNYVTCGITLDDIRGSGIDGSSIQYSISLNGVSNYGPWERLEISGSFETISVQTPSLYFNRDTVNYIKWRAKDTAGNGWTYSPDIPIEVTALKRNMDPVVIITSPTGDEMYDTTSVITFDGSASEDPNGDNLTFLWYSDIDGYLGTEPILYKGLSDGEHKITLAVSDGKSNRTYTVIIKVYPSLSRLDTDEDGIYDLEDTDDDNDGLLDIQEDKNRNGFFDYNETNPKDYDTDKDSVSDGEDWAPLDPKVWREPKDHLMAGWIIWFIIFVIIVLLIVMAFIFVLKQRTDREKTKAKIELKRTKRNLRRFEVLTGVPTNDLPAIEAVQWALPGVIAEASEFILEAPPTDDLLPPSPEDAGAKVPEVKVSQPRIEDMETPMPKVSERPTGPEPPLAAKTTGSRVISCSLCGSEVPVAEGATSVECPLCGELINL